jgi:enhancing lycopene biosynthesis protein 2
MNIGVLLAGNGVYDGSAIHEAVFTLLAIAETGATYKCIAPNKNQHHVINHMTGEEMSESRNVLLESARIARGDIQDLATVNLEELDGLVIPGGFGAAKNLNQWAISGAEGGIDTEVKKLILDCIKAKKPIAALCMGPTVVASALAGEDFYVSMTVGTTEAPSPYHIQGISDGMASLGVQPEMATIEEVIVDHTHKIVTAPCYMMEASIVAIRENVAMAIGELVRLIQEA